MDYLKIGLIKKPHGIRGELKVLPLSDDFSRFKKLKSVFLESSEGFSEKKITSVKLSSDEIIIKFDDCLDRDNAEKYRNFYIWVDREDAVELDEWEFYSQDLIGMNVYYEELLVGVVSDIQNFGANDNLDIKLSNGKSVYYPFHRDFLEKVDLDSGLIKIKQYEGFFD